MGRDPDGKEVGRGQTVYRRKRSEGIQIQKKSPYSSGQIHFSYSKFFILKLGLKKRA